MTTTPISWPVDLNRHPIPPGRGQGRDPLHHYPFAGLEPGQSFTVGLDSCGAAQIAASVLTRYTDRTYLSRRVRTRSGHKALRIWRTK